MTSGPAYHFEPAWSPDGARVAFAYTVDRQSRDRHREPRMAVASRPISSHPSVDIQPAWSRDGKSLFFTSARAGGWRIFRHDFAARHRHAADERHPAGGVAGRQAPRVRAERPARARPRDQRVTNGPRRGDRVSNGAGVDAGRSEHSLRHRGRRIERHPDRAGRRRRADRADDGRRAPRDVAGGQPRRHALRLRAVRRRRADALHRGHHGRARERLAQGADHGAPERDADRPRADSRGRTRRPARRRRGSTSTPATDVTTRRTGCSTGR